MFTSHYAIRTKLTVVEAHIASYCVIVRFMNTVQFQSYKHKSIPVALYSLYIYISFDII